MKVGDYVRTKKDGIGKIISFSYQEDDECCFIELSNRRTGIKQFNIIKSSPNIIDLIEVGDYVNGGKVIDIAQKPKKAVYVEDVSQQCGLIPIVNSEIESVLTQEQFKSMEYKVVE